MKNYHLGILSVSLLSIILTNIFLGSVHIPPQDIIAILLGNTASKASWVSIVWDFRLPKLLTAVLVGVGLSVSGLQMQTLFRNPLASPDLLGVSSGAALGVAIVVLAHRLLGLTTTSFVVIMAAGTGATTMLLLMLLVSKWLANPQSLLIVGFMLTALVGAMISLLQYFSQSQDLQQYILWTHGSLSNTTWDKLPLLGISVTIGTTIATTQAKALNALLLGNDYAASMGIDVKYLRGWTLLAVGLTVGSITAFCGFIGFVAVVIPQLTSIWLRTTNHHVLLLVSSVLGACFLLFCDTLCYLPSETYSLPINVITSLLGTPVVAWLLLRKKY